MENKLKEVAISFVKTFLATFLSIFGTLLIQLPNEVLLNPDAWKTGVVGALVVGIVRSALSESWKKTLPVALGGEKKS